MSGIFAKLFAGQQQQQAQQSNQSQQKPQPQATQQKPVNLNDPNNLQASASQNQNQDPATTSPANPLDIYNGLWDTKQQQQQAPSFNLDAAALTNVSNGLKFSDGIDQNLMQQALGGDVSAFAQIMDQVGRKAYETSLQHGSILTDKFVGARQEYEASRTTGQVKKELISQNLQASHPLIKKELKRVAEMMYAANPDASPADIATAAQEYFANLQSAMSGNMSQDQQPNGKGPKDVDWDDFFEDKE